MGSKESTKPTTHSTTYLDNPTHTISYTNYGPSNPSQALVFLHGWTCDSSLWLPGHQPLLQKSARRILLIDLPGHGASSADSSGRTDYNVEFFADAVNAVLDTAGVTSAVFVGHSLGGVVASTFLRQHPAKVLGIIYVDSFFSLPEHYMSRAERHRTKEACRGDQFRHAFEPVYTARTTPALRKQIVDVSMATDEFVRLSTKASDLLPPFWRADEVFPDLPGMAIVAVDFLANVDLYPEWTRCIPRLEQERWNDGIAKDEEKYGHFCFMEDPDRSMKSIEGFLARHKLLQA